MKVYENSTGTPCAVFYGTGGNVRPVVMELMLQPTKSGPGLSHGYH